MLCQRSAVPFPCSEPSTGERLTVCLCCHSPSALMPSDMPQQPLHFLFLWHTLPFYFVQSIWGYIGGGIYLGATPGRGVTGPFAAALPPTNTLSWMASALKFLCADAVSQRLVFLQAAFDNDRAGPRKGSGRPSTCRDRKWSLVGSCWWQLCLPYLKFFFIAAYFA